MKNRASYQAIRALVFYFGFCCCLHAAPIHVAARAGDVEKVRALLAADPTLLDAPATESYDTEGSPTALICAARYGHLEVVKLLLEKGANIEAHTWGQPATALSWAAANGHTAIVKLLLEKGAKLEAHSVEWGSDFVLIGACCGAGARIEVVKLLPDKGADIEARDGSGNTALLAAASVGQTEIVRLLLNKGASIEAFDYINQETALLKAAARGYTETVKLLLDKGARIEAKNKIGNTALTLALGMGNTGLAKLLQDRGAHL
jgi:ankyrin repeat protein